MTASIFHSRGTVVGLVALLAASLAAPARAQIGVSARIEGMGHDFAGVVDDAVTDAALNPARLGAFGRSQVYVGRLARTNWILQFPGWTGYFPRSPQAETLPGSVVLEGYPLPSAQPATITWFTPVGDDMAASFTIDAASYGNDDANASTTIDPTTYPLDNGFTSKASASGSQQEFNDFRLDAALSTSRDPHARAWGGRVTVEYKKFHDTYSSSSMNTTWPQDDPAQLIVSQGVRKDKDLSDQFSADATLAVYRPGRALRDASVTAGAVRVTRDNLAFRQDVSDEDYDGDGIDPGGGVPRYEFELSDHGAGREYTGVEGSVRAVFAYGARVRSVHTASFASLAGDGSADIATSDLYRTSGTNDGTVQVLNYAYDGDITRIDATSSVGMVEEIIDHVSVAGVVRGRYARDELDEDASGDGAITISQFTTSTTFASPYRQNVSVVWETLQFNVSVAGEWEASRYLTFRTGVVYEAMRTESDASVRRDVPGLSALQDGGTGTDASNVVDYRTTTSFRAGLGVRLAERLFVDMYTGTLSFASYSYGTVRFLF